MSQGWECPKCGAVYAPWVASCRNCKGRHTETAMTPFTPPYVPGDGTSRPYNPTRPYYTS